MHSGKSYESVLSLVDLAGSENLKESGSEGERKIETGHINKSLSNLTRVIGAQAQANKKHTAKVSLHKTWSFLS